MARRRRPPRPGALTELPPLKILSQILLLQTIYYTVAFALILFTALVAGRHFNLDMVLDWRRLRGDTTVGWMLGLVWLLNSFIGVIAILFFIARSKLVPDFAITLHVIHLLVTSFYSHSIPRNWLWWALQVVSAGMMTSLGVWSCQWRELRPITFGGSSAAQPSSSETAASPNTGEAGDEEQGYGRGRGRGRGRDGAGEYEMVDRNPEAEAAK
ncbi:hypothetical protein GLAREA_10100 [Glarea lozoyensis ATCC 20868]|uniref:Uncharacterized protein n=1 Tax=Glarea lozoyensis (strain ATCC 20868 / MF5171) TaxID=1116229 RepID=S3DQV8_GLAL2|nr:uncharacterized protein GLAREA_10100 [Glarea lozoyensis ATCC 20868]EPE34406.1 hypothetical protein GLAREA_10100 [Glarea lozoyensis ATCC 20868]